MGVLNLAVAFNFSTDTWVNFKLFGGMGVIQGMPIEKYVRDAIVQKHISFPFPTRYRITEALTGYKRKLTPYLGNT